MTHIAVWTVLRLVFLLYLHKVECNHRCFSCQNLPLPRLCQTVVTCQHQTEVCYVERVNTGGHMLYNSGCTPQICLGSGGVSLVGKRSSNRLPRAANDTCMECCTDDYCNLNGCGMTDIAPTMRGPHCFDCNVFTSPSECNHIRTCMSDEACVMQEHPALMGASDVNYQSRCMKQTECAANVATAVSATSPCPPVCCAGDFCNTRCRHYPAVARTTTPIPPYAAIIAKSCRDKIFNGYLYDSFINLCASVRKVTHPVTRAEAASACAADNATLITLDSAKKMDFLLGMIFSHKENDTDFWIGATSDVNYSHVFHWPDGSPITYNHFGGKMMAQPDDRRLHNEDCVFINNKDMYRWHDAQCESRKTGYICEAGHTSTHDKASVCHSLVFNGFFYDQHSDFCVTLIQVPAPGITHTAAVAECKKFGTNLVTINNQDRTDFILSWIFSNRENATDFWIGAYDKHNNSEFYWPSGAKVTYANWGGPDYSDIPDIPGTQPDAPRVHNETCVYMSYIYNYYWFDEACSQRKKGYMCELTGKDATEKENKCRQHLFAGYYYDHYTDMCVLLEPNGGIHGIDRHGALSQCQRVGGRLIVIDTQRKMDFVLYQIFSHRANDTDFWIDAQDINGDGTFYWSTNQSVTWSHWYQAPTENCAYADYIDRYNWYPASCNAKKPGYVCEINKYTLTAATTSELPPTTPPTTPVRQILSCGHAGYLTQDNGVIDSHLGFATNQDYPNDLNCRLTIQAPAGKAVQLSAKSFDLESHSSCNYDYLEVFNGDGVSGRRLGKFCGNSMPTVTSIQNFLTLHFHTDQATHQKGFRLQYTFVNASTLRQTSSCGHAGYLTQDNGVIDSHLGFATNQDYPNDLNCRWTIQAPAGKAVQLTYTRFDLERYSVWCNYDYLEVFDGDGVSGRRLGKFCGNSMPTVTSSQTFLTLHFHTDETTHQKGFRLQYTFVKPSTHGGR